MKTTKIKILIFILLIFIFYTNCSYGYTEVYITNTGSKYHLSGCQYLRKSQISINLEEAIKKGYEPCEKCGANFIVRNNDNNSNTDSHSFEIPKVCPNCNLEILEGNGQYCFECGYDLETGTSQKNTISIVSGSSKKTRNEYYEEIQSLNKTINEKNKKITELEDTVTQYKKELSKKEDNSHIFIGASFILLIGICISYNIGLYKNKNNSLEKK